MRKSQPRFSELYVPVLGVEVVIVAGVVHVAAAALVVAEAALVAALAG